MKCSRSQLDSGYMLLGAVVMVALVLISLSVAAPVVAREIRRDKEVESQRRAQQYVRAVQLYYRKFGHYPPSTDALEKSNNVRFLRQKYSDPLTGKSDWRLIHLGQQKTTIKGFFGQELTDLTPGFGSAGGTSPNSPSSGGAAPASGGGSPLAGGFNDPNNGTPPGNPAPGSSGSTGSTGSIGSTGGTGSDDGSNLGVIIGVGTMRTGPSILEPNAQATYETWEFWYDPRIELLKRRANLLGGVSSEPATHLGQNTSTPE